MRLGLPASIPLSRTFLALTALFVVQRLEHTSIAFSLLFFGFTMLGNLAFNLAGGFTRTTGAYVFFFTLLTCPVGVVLKAFLGEAANSNLQEPLLDMGAYLASMIGLLAVVLAIRRFRTGKRSFAQIMATVPLNYTLSGLGCFIVMIGIQAFNMVTVRVEPGSLLTAINQLNVFPSLAILLLTIGTIKSSGGRRSFNIMNILPIGVVSVLGIVGFSKQGMLTPLACWTMAVMYMRFRVRWIHLIGLGLVVWFSLSIVPLIASGRNFVTADTDTFSGRVAITYAILNDLNGARALADEQVASTYEHPTTTIYFNRPLGFIERFTAMPVDDAFFAYTARGNYIGLLPIKLDFENLVPHFILPNKPGSMNGNYYARKIGGFLPPDDTSTGISFSPVAEAFHVAGWYGILLLLPCLWLLLLGSMEMICGDLREQPWGLFVAVGFAHSAAESLLVGIVYGIGYGSLTLLVAIFFCTRFTPILGTLFLGGQSGLRRNEQTVQRPLPGLR